MVNQDPVSMAVSGVVVVVLIDYLRQHQAWGWFRLASGPPNARAHPGLRFAKVMGSGHEGGFTLRPSATHQGLVAVFEIISIMLTLGAGTGAAGCVVTG